MYHLIVMLIRSQFPQRLLTHKVFHELRVETHYLVKNMSKIFTNPNKCVKIHCGCGCLNDGQRLPKFRMRFVKIIRTLFLWFFQSMCVKLISPNLPFPLGAYSFVFFFFLLASHCSRILCNFFSFILYGFTISRKKRKKFQRGKTFKSIRFTLFYPPKEKE